MKNLLVIQTEGPEAAFDVISAVLDYADKDYAVSITSTAELAAKLATAVDQLVFLQASLNQGMSKSNQKLAAESIGEVLAQLV